MLTGMRRAWDGLGRDIRLMLLSIAVVGLCSGGLFAALFNLYLLRLGHNAALIGRVNAAGWLTYGSLSLPAGLISRRVGIWRTLVAGMALWSLGLVLLCQGELVAVHLRECWFLTTRVLASTGMALYFPNYVAALIGLCDEGQRDRVFAIEWSILTLGGFVGSLASGWLVTAVAAWTRSSAEQALPYRYALSLASAGMLLSIWALWTARVEPSAIEPDAHGVASGGEYRAILGFAAFYTLMIAGVEGVVQWFNVYMDTTLGTPVAYTGLLLGLAQLASAAGAQLMPPVVARWGRRHGIVGALLLASATLLPVMLVRTVGVASLGFLALNGLGAMVGAMATLFGQLLVIPRWRPAMSGAVGAASGLGSGLAMWAGGRVISAGGFGPFFLSCALAISLSAVAFVGQYGCRR